MGLIQTPDQLRFSYLALIEGAKRLFPSNANEVRYELLILLCVVVCYADWIKCCT